MKLSLQDKILAPVVLTILLVIGGSAFVLSDILVERFEDRVADMLFAGNEILSKDIRAAATSYKSILRALSIMPTLRGAVDGKASPSNASNLLKRFSEIFPQFLQFNLADAMGRVIAGSNGESIGQVNVSDRKYFSLALDGHESMSEPLVSKSTGRKAVIVAAPVRSAEGDIRGVVYGIVSCESIIADTIKDVKMSGTGYAYIVDGRSGLMLAHEAMEKVGMMNMFSWQPWMKHLADTDSGIRKDYTDSRGMGRVAAYHKDPVSGWIAVSCITKEEIEKQESFIRNAIFLLSFVGATLAGAIICVVLRPVTRDILNAGRYACGVAAGRPGGSLEVRRDDELGALCESLRIMVSSLEGHVRRELKITEEHRGRLAAMRDAMMLTLADLVESRDKNTGQHVRKTAAYAGIILRELKRQGAFPDELTDELADDIIRSAPLHDIGKIAVSDAILNKPGKLTDEEFSAMKEHAAAGGRIIRRVIEGTPDSGYLSEAEQLALRHHERWDGKGYPDGLAGKDIPLSARVMAVADVFDALVSERPYKKGFPLEKAFAVIEEESGSHFDPKVVQAFLAAKEEIMAAEKFFREESANA